LLPEPYNLAENGQRLPARSDTACPRKPREKRSSPVQTRELVRNDGAFVAALRSRSSNAMCSCAKAAI